ncbi:MAG: AAA family ATPase [Nitrosotalea sp.]
MSAVVELESIASKYASEAIRQEEAGARGMAITSYQRAVDALLKLIQLFPENPINTVYKDRCNTYQSKIKSLRGYEESSPDSGNRAEPDIKPNPDMKHGSTANAPTSGGEFDKMIIKEKPNVSWSEVIGHEDAKRALRESIVYPTKRPDLFTLGWPKGILLYGPPGCGKTLLAAASASEIQGDFINVDAAAVMSKWLGEAEKNVSKLFGMARSYATNNNPVILLIDEVDSLLGDTHSENGGEVRVKNQFLTEMDGISSKGKNTQMYVMAATNKPWNLDWPFLRRFTKRIYIPLPSLEARENLFSLYISKIKSDHSVDLKKLALATDGYSASDIKDICQSTQLQIIDEFFEKMDLQKKDIAGGAQPREITIKDFEDVVSRRRPSVNNEMLDRYSKWTKEFGAL